MWRISLVLALLAAPCGAQQLRCCTFRDWATSGSVPFRNHPSAHALGGLGLDLVARGPWFAASWRDKAWKRLLFVAVMQSGWEYWQLKETQGYPVRYAALDVGTTVLSAALLEAILR